MPKPAFLSVTIEEVDRLSRPTINRLNEFVKLARPPDEADGREEESKASPTDQQQGGAMLTTDEQDYLRSIFEQPFLNLGHMASYVGFPKKTTENVRKALTGKELIEEFRLTLGKSVGGYASYTTLTQGGYQAINEMPVVPFKGKKGGRHRFLQYFVHAYLVERGFAAEIEMNLNGKCADVGYDNDGTLVALEIADRKDNEVTNVKRDLQVGFHRIITLCTTRTVFTKVERDFKKFLSDEELARVEIVLLADSEFAKALIR